MSSEVPMQHPRRVLLIITGGTICMKPRAKDGWSMTELSCSTMADLFDSLPTFQDPSLPEYEILEWEELLDSSDVSHEHWAKMSEQIRDNYHRFDGFVILHGTDSLAFTSSALSFIFEKGLSKTIVVTGAMLPMSHLNTDALRNVTVSMLVAAYSQLADVLVCFGTRILKGNRVVKTNCTVMDAYDTPNYPHIGQIGMDITMNSQNWLRSMLDVLSDDERSRLVNRIAPNLSDDAGLVPLSMAATLASHFPNSSHQTDSDTTIAVGDTAGGLDAARASNDQNSSSLAHQSMQSNPNPYNDGDHPSNTNQFARDGLNYEKYTLTKVAEPQIQNQNESHATGHHCGGRKGCSLCSNSAERQKYLHNPDLPDPRFSADSSKDLDCRKSTNVMVDATTIPAESHDSCAILPPRKRGCHEDRDSQTLSDFSPATRFAAPPGKNPRLQAQPHGDVVCADLTPAHSWRSESNCSCTKDTSDEAGPRPLVSDTHVSVSSAVRRNLPQIFTKLLVDHVCVLRVTPSFDPIFLRQLAAAEREPFGVILQLYGTGTAPSNARFLKAVQFAINSGVTIVAVTQCTSGSCSLMTYANGVQLHKLGVIEGKDLTTEAALTKLAYLFGKGYKGEELALKMESNLRGELCPTVYKITGQATLKPTQTSPSNMLEHNKHFRLSARAGASVCTQSERDKKGKCSDPQEIHLTDAVAVQPCCETYSPPHDSLTLNLKH